MRTTYKTWTSRRQTPQSQPLAGRAMVANNAGGYVFAVDDWTRLERFLILGSAGGTYYVSEQTLTVANAEAVLRCLAADGPRLVDTIVAISDGGRAPRNDPALFALALAMAHGDLATRSAAREALPKVARIGTHLFSFLAYVGEQRGWGRSLRRAVADWYRTMAPDRLAFQAVKYQQRGGFAHRDALRLSHPVARDAQQNALFRWIAGKELDQAQRQSLPRTLEGFERSRSIATAKEAVALIADDDLPWEALPSRFLAEPSVWQALVPRLPLEATLRNLGRLGALELLKSRHPVAKLVVDKLSDGDYLRASRLHPLRILVALNTYRQGHGERGSLRWEPMARVADALDAAFYASFGNVRPTGQRLLLALDISGSMSCGQLAGMTGVTPRVGSAAMALVTAAVEREHQFVAFTSGSRPSQWSRSHGLGSGIEPLDISPRQRLDDVVQRLGALPMGGTDCALPMVWALEQKLPVDGFVVYTDSETWAGNVHPAQALWRYRQEMGIGAKLVVVGMTSTGFSIADPNDAGMLDVVGFDLATPNVIGDFVAA